MRLAAAIVVVGALAAGPGCYIGIRAGPAFHSGAAAGERAEGIEWDVIAGVELYLDQPAALNPLAGKTRVAMGVGGVSSRSDAAAERTARSGAGEGGGVTAPAGELQLGAGLFTLELGRTIIQRAGGGSDGDPDHGGQVRVVASLATGSGAIAIRSADGLLLHDGEATALGVSAGVEAGLHAGGSSIDSIGVFVGAGVRSTHFVSDLGDTKSVSPYLSLSFEGGILLQILGEGLRGLGRCR